MSHRLGLIGSGPIGRRWKDLAPELPYIAFAGKAEAVEQGIAAGYGTSMDTVIDLSAADEFDALVCAVPPFESYDLARQLVMSGKHVFLDWPPTNSLRECRELVAVSEEAGVEIGVNLPLRYVPGLVDLPDGWRAELISLHQGVYTHGPVLTSNPWPTMMAFAIDMCCRAAGNEWARRMSVKMVRSPNASLNSIALTLGFENGALAQVVLGNAATEEGLMILQSRSGIRRIDVTPAIQAMTDLGVLPSTRAPFTSQNPSISSLQAFIELLTNPFAETATIAQAYRIMQMVERLMAKSR